MKTSRSIALITALTITSGATLSAQFFGGLPIMGAGIPVYDAGALIEAVKQTVQLIQQYQQLRTTYEHLKWQAKKITNLGRYTTPKTVWHEMTAGNLSQKTSNWVMAVNKGVNAADGWNTTVTQMNNYPVSIPPSHWERKRIEMAGIELSDGTAISAIDTVGRVRLVGPKIETVLDLLQSDSLSEDPEMHTDAAQLNKANAIAILQTRELANTNKLLVASAEIALMRLRQEREAAGYALQNDVAYRSEGKAAAASTLSGGSAAMTAFRLP